MARTSATKVQRPDHRSSGSPYRGNPVTFAWRESEVDRPSLNVSTTRRRRVHDSETHSVMRAFTSVPPRTRRTLLALFVGPALLLHGACSSEAQSNSLLTGRSAPRARA